MTNEHETAAEAELAEAIRVWDRVHSAYKENKASKAEDDVAGYRRDAAQEAVDREKAAKPKESPKETYRGQQEYDPYDHEALADEPNG